MKSLQEVWDKIAELEAQNVLLLQQFTALQEELAALNVIRAVRMEMVTVGDPGNGADPGNSAHPNTYGAVPYEFKIGKYEVTNEQYATFLNAVASTDTHSLYNSDMGSNARGGIDRSGSDGSYTYAVKPNMGNKPVNFVNWYNAVRFCNWLHNGQPGGAQDNSTTEGGAYTLTGTTSIAVGSDPVHGANGRNAGARFWLPSEKPSNFCRFCR